MTACIVGWNHLPFGKHEGREVESLIVEAAAGALADAGIAGADVDEIYLGHFNGGFVAQDFTSSLVLGADEALRFKPATRVENACATGSAAVHQGLRAIAAKDARIVLVVGVEKMTELSGAAIGDTLLRCAYVKEEKGIEGGFAGVFGRSRRDFQRHGDQSDALAAIAAKNHKNGCANPYAQLRKDRGSSSAASLGQEPAGRRPAQAHRLLAGLRRCRGPGADRRQDGAGMKKAVAFRAWAELNDFLPMSKRDIVAFEGCTAPGRRR